MKEKLLRSLIVATLLIQYSCVNKHVNFAANGLIKTQNLKLSQLLKTGRISLSKMTGISIQRQLRMTY